MGGTNAQLPIGRQESLPGQCPPVALSHRRAENLAEGKDDSN
jgi:hypothetical protein